MSSPRSQAWLAGALVALAALCICGLAFLVVASSGLILVTSRVAAQATPLPTLNPTQVVEEMDAIEAWVVAHRGLQPSGPVEQKFLTVDEVRERVLADFEEDTSPEEVADDAQVLAAFGLMQPGGDLYSLFVRLYSEGVSGFYDPDSGELVLVSATQGLNAYERAVFAHEYAHALQDQVYGLRASGFDGDLYDADPERYTAIQAVLEGDASLLEEQYTDTLTQAERREYDAVVNALDVSIYSELPPFLLRDFIFPYREGLDFVRQAYNRDGWPGVDALWQDPPVSTEQILHPERYAAGDTPVIVAQPALTDTLGGGWRLLDESVNGEWYTFLLLAYGIEAKARVSERQARTAVEGWGGDGYSVYADDASGQLALAARWVWDTPEDAQEFATALQEYGEGRFGPSDEAAPGRVCWTRGPVTCFYLGQQDSLWLSAPDQATLERVRSQYPD